MLRVFLDWSLSFFLPNWYPPPIPLMWDPVLLHGVFSLFSIPLCIFGGTSLNHFSHLSWFQNSFIQLQICYALSLQKKDTCTNPANLIFCFTRFVKQSINSLGNDARNSAFDLLWTPASPVFFLLNSLCVTFFHLIHSFIGLNLTLDSLLLPWNDPARVN